MLRTEERHNVVVGEGGEEERERERETKISKREEME